MRIRKLVTLTAGIATAVGMTYAVAQRRPNVRVSLTDVDGVTIDLPLSATIALDLRVAAADVRRAFEADVPSAAAASFAADTSYAVNTSSAASL